MIPKFNDFVNLVHQKTPRIGGKFRGRVLALDPGETTGWSVWDSHDNSTRYELFKCGQMDSWDKNAKPQTMQCIKPCVLNFIQLLHTMQPDEVVMESYRVYEWKADDHSWSDVPTLRIVGCIETYLHMRNIPYVFQTAQSAKHFVTDDLLQQWGYWVKGQRHARDSMRHALYYITFGAQGQQK